MTEASTQLQHALQLVLRDGRELELLRIDYWKLRASHIRLLEAAKEARALLSGIYRGAKAPPVWINIKQRLDAAIAATERDPHASTP